jgi:tetratricopeptide (TPR) repeat protein
MLLSTNHFLSDTFRNVPLNIKNRQATSSGYRYEHLQELMDAETVDYKRCAAILRDQRGKAGKDIGMCNEKAVNQLIAHHSVIFQPEHRRMWISTSAFMLGEYVCYDLDSVFGRASVYDSRDELYDRRYTIAADTFLSTAQWQEFLIYKKGETELNKIVSGKHAKEVPLKNWEELISHNPEYWFPYYLTGQYYEQIGQKDKALPYLKQALSKEINDSVDIYDIKALIERLEHPGH